MSGILHIILYSESGHCLLYWRHIQQQRYLQSWAVVTKEVPLVQQEKKILHPLLYLDFDLVTSGFFEQLRCHYFLPPVLNLCSLEKLTAAVSFLMAMALVLAFFLLVTAHLKMDHIICVSHKATRRAISASIFHSNYFLGWFCHNSFQMCCWFR